MTSSLWRFTSAKNSQINIYWSNGAKKYEPDLIPHTLVDRAYSFNYILQQSELR